MLQPPLTFVSFKKEEGVRGEAGAVTHSLVALQLQNPPPPPAGRGVVHRKCETLNFFNASFPQTRAGPPIT